MPIFGKISSMHPDLRSVLITGASTGIGYALAQRLDAAGWRVFAGVRNDADAQRLRAVLSVHGEPGAARCHRCRGYRANARARSRVRTGGRLDAVVNNAGIVFHGPVDGLSVAALRRQLDVNVVGVFAVTRAFLPLVRATRGRVSSSSCASSGPRSPGRSTESTPHRSSPCATRRIDAHGTALLRRARCADRTGRVCHGDLAEVHPAAVRRSRWLEPGVQAHDAAAMRIIERAMQTIAIRAPQPDRCVDVIVRALTAKAPRAFYRAGNDIVPQLLFAMVPPCVKDPLIATLMNLILGRATRAQAELGGTLVARDAGRASLPRRQARDRIGSAAADRERLEPTARPSPQIPAYRASDLSHRVPLGSPGAEMFPARKADYAAGSLPGVRCRHEKRRAAR